MNASLSFSKAAWCSGCHSNLVSFRVRLSESGKRDYRVREIDDKTSVEICESKKGLDLFQVRWDSPITNSFCFCDVHQNACGGDHKSKEFDRMSMKEGFLGFDVRLSTGIRYQGYYPRVP